MGTLLVFVHVAAIQGVFQERLELPGAVGLPTVARTGPGGTEVLAAVTWLPAILARAFGVDEWR